MTISRTSRSCSGISRFPLAHLTLIAGCGLAIPAWAGPGGGSQAPTRDATALLDTLTRTVLPSVVQIRVEAFGLVEDLGRTTTGLVAGPQERAGSGAIIDVDGYIVTNAHLVAGAQSIQVKLSRRSVAQGDQAAPAEYDTLDARIVGMAPQFDLALLKVAATGLPSLRIAGSETVHQGQVVFSFGRWEGLRSSVTMGIVSSVALQLDWDAPAIYLQTDAPGRIGTGGGPLVNVDGELVGVNAFSTAETIGKQGPAFAIPGAVVAEVYPRLRVDGHLRTAIPGMQVQAITPALMAGLGLPTTWGVVVSDVSPGGAADRAGIKVEDVVQSINGQLTNTVPAFALSVATLGPVPTITIGLRRGPRHLSIEVPMVTLDATRTPDLREFETTWIAQLGIVATDVTPSVPVQLPPLRIPSGVVVAAREQRSLDREVPLMTGDVIHAVDGVAVSSVSGLRGLLNGVAARSPVVLQVERGGRLRFITVEVF